MTAEHPGDPARDRYERVQAAMARRGVGALLLATPHLGAFASGARRVQVAGSGGTLPWVVVAAGAAAAVVFTPDPDGAPSWMPRAHVEPLRWSRQALLGRVAALVAPTRGAVACDVLVPALGAVLRDAAPGRPVIDAGPLLAEARGPRSAAEVSAIARAVGAARAGLEAAAACIPRGHSVASLLTGFAGSLGAAGAGFPLGEGLAWRAGRHLEPVLPEDPLPHDGALALEVGLYVGGHAGIAGDTYACGADDLEPLRRRWAEAARVMAAYCRTGVSVADLAAAAVAVGAGEAGLLAHGLGVGIEPPYVHLARAAAEEREPLLARTVLVLAPVVRRGAASFRATRAVLVTDDGPKWLETPP